MGKRDMISGRSKRKNLRLVGRRGGEGCEKEQGKGERPLQFSIGGKGPDCLSIRI